MGLSFQGNRNFASLAYSVAVLDKLEKPEVDLGSDLCKADKLSTLAKRSGRFGTRLLLSNTWSGILYSTILICLSEKNYSWSRREQD